MNPQGDAPASATPFEGVSLLAVPSASLMLACQMLPSAMWCARVMWLYFDGLAGILLRGAKKEKTGKRYFRSSGA